MEKFYYKLQKVLFLVAFFTLLSTLAKAQTLTIGSVDVGPYTPGSSIAVPFNTSGDCIKPNNVFKLYISSVPNGIPDIEIGSYIGHYATFVNGNIPTGLTPGNYNLAIKSSNAPVTSDIKSINIVTGSAVVAKLTAPLPNTSYPDVFGNCSGNNNNNDRYFFTNTSTTGSTVTAGISDEITHGTQVPLTFNAAQGATFTASKHNYTIFVKAVDNNGFKGTVAYQLINNQLSTNFGTRNGDPVCLSNGEGILSYQILPDGIEGNYPGNIYTVKWGDGTSTQYTLCDLIASRGNLSHAYNRPSCGTTSGRQNNSFQVDAQASNVLCDDLGSPITSYARVVEKPVNNFTGPKSACLNVPVTFTNKSNPGQNASSTSLNCQNDNALYTWVIDEGTPDEVQLSNYTLSTPFSYTFTTPGNHTITLKFQPQGNTVCGADDFTQIICVLAQPQPRFSLINTTVCTGATVIPNENSIIDQSCAANPLNNVYNWTVKSPVAYAFVNNTSAASQHPELTFSVPGIYTITLSISTESCGAFSTEQTLVVNELPTVSLSPNKAFCDKSQPFTFDASAGPTQTLFTGTTVDQPDTYTWTVSPNTYSFQNGTNANSKYPQILFNNFTTYTVTATQTNNCGTASDTQLLDFRSSPVINAGRVQPICPTDIVQLNGTITGTYQSFEWTGGAGTFSNPNSLTSTYTPTNAETASGRVVLTLHVVTGNPSPCDQIYDDVVITIYPQNQGVNAAKSICTGDYVSFQATSSVQGSTFTWISNASNASGNSTNSLGGSGNINDVLTNTDGLNNGTVVYTITPFANGCQGTPFTLTVTVTPKPVLSVSPTTICSGQPAELVFNFGLNPTTYKWTSVASAGITGNSNQATAASFTGINEALTNTSNNTAGTVTYTIIPVSSAGCEGTPVTVTVTVQPLPATAVAGNNQQLCNETSAQLAGNNPGISTGTWTFIPAFGQSQSDVSFNNANQYDTRVTGFQPGKLYTFRWTITGAAPCNATFDEVSINNLSPLTNTISFGAAAICYGQTATVIGSQPTGGNGSFVYRWESSADGNANWTIIPGQTNQNYTFTGAETIYIRRVVLSAPCSSFSDPVHIIVQPAISNNTILADQTICYNNIPTLLTGSTPAGADGNFIYQWQQKMNGETLWTNVGSAISNYQPDALTVTTTFRRIVTSTICSGDQKSISNNVTITVTPLNTNTITSDASRIICTGTTFSYQPRAQQSGTSFTWTYSATANISPNTGSGSGNINNVFINSDPNNNGTVTYIITPNNNNCPGTPFTLTVTVTPIPRIILTNNGQQICSGNPAGITFRTNTPGVLVRWTFDRVQGITGANDQFPVMATRINDVLTSSRTTPGTIIYHLTPISEGGCEGPTVEATVTVLPQPVTANAGADEVICSAATYTLNGNNPEPSTGKWTVTSGQSGVGFADATQYNTAVSGLQPGQTYTFLWTITSTGACTTSTDEVVISDLRDLTNNISFANPAVCYGQTISVAGDLPTGGNGSFVYRWESSADNSNWTTVPNQTDQNYSFTGTESIYVRRVVTSGPCIKISATVYIIVQPQITNNTVASDQEVCYNNTPKLLTGSTPAGADGRYIYNWQSSADNGASWTNISGANEISYQVNSLTVTTTFRRIVTSVLCNGPQQSVSNIIKVTVNPLPNAVFTYTKELGCIPFVLDAQNIKATNAIGNNTYTWYADGVFIGSGFTFPGYTIKEDDKKVEIKLVVSSKFGCPDASFTHVFSTIKEVTPGFNQNQTKGCGPLTVTFTNISDPLNQATYTWNFGNGTTSTSTNPGAITYLPRTDGKDTTYTITLRALTTCGIRTATSTVTVRPKPISIFSPNKTTGCSPLTVNFNNTSPGTNNVYTFDFGDGQTLVTHDNQQVNHTYIAANNKVFTVKMTAENECGKSVTQYNISISPNTVLPQLIVNGNQKAGCAPWTVQFYNNTTGGNYFKYDFGDGTTLSTLNAPEVVSHTFLKDGIFNVKMTATNGCSDTSAYQSITVYAQPKTNFTADVQLGCTQLNVNFKNLTPGNNTYLWDFGDGSTSTVANPTHVFAGRNTPYTVSLIAKNTLGCADTSLIENYITVSIPPKAAFITKPDSVIVYPYYSFSFADKSTNNPILWKWSFGDGSSASKQNPAHTYRDTGVYVVKLVVYNLQGCADSVSHKVQITGTPGQLFVPNAFMPDSKFGEITTFKIKGSGIKTWRFRVFNKWGQVIWETTKLTDRGEPAEGWDGMMGGAPAPQGVYVWQVDATYINGNEWKGMSYKGSAPNRQGFIHLIR